MGSKTKLPVSGLYSVSRKTYDNQGRPYQVFEPATGAVSSYTSTVSTIIGMSNRAVSAFPSDSVSHDELRVNANAFEYAVMGRFQ